MTFLKHKSGSVDSLLKNLSPPPLSFQQMLLGTMFKDFSKPGCCFIYFNNLPSSAAILNSVWASSISEANSYSKPKALGLPFSVYYSLYTGPLVYYHLLHYELSSLCIPCALSTLWVYVEFIRGFPGGSVIKESAWRCRRCWRLGFDPWSGGSPGRGNGNLLQDSCQENSMDRRV